MPKSNLLHTEASTRNNPCYSKYVKTSCLDSLLQMVFVRGLRSAVI